MRSYHSVTILNYHLIIVTKYRRKVITDIISADLSEIFSRIGENYGITIQEFNHDKDHIHVLFLAQSTTQLATFINAYKSASSRIVKKHYPEIKNQLWEEHFWSRSYYLATLGENTVDVVARYIEKQGES